MPVQEPEPVDHGCASHVQVPVPAPVLAPVPALVQAQVQA